MDDTPSFDGVPIEITCPECGETVRRTVGQLKHAGQVTCSQGHTTELDVEAFRQEIESSEREWARLREVLENRSNGGRRL